MPGRCLRCHREERRWGTKPRVRTMKRRKTCGRRGSITGVMEKKIKWRRPRGSAAPRAPPLAAVRRRAVSRDGRTTVTVHGASPRPSRRRCRAARAASRILPRADDDVVDQIDRAEFQDGGCRIDRLQHMHGQPVVSRASTAAPSAAARPGGRHACCWPCSSSVRSMVRRLSFSTLTQASRADGERRAAPARR